MSAHITFQFKQLKSEGKRPLGRLGVDERIILKWI
jgi:hypothetical protein